VLEHWQLAQRSPNPEVTEQDRRRAAEALALRPRPANDPLCKLHLRRIQFASTAAADKAGIDIGLVERGPITEVIEANAQTEYDSTRMARLSARGGGTVWRVEKTLGQSVAKGEMLALIDAAVIGQANAELLQALAQIDLHQATRRRLSTVGDGVVAGRRLEETEAALAEAEAAAQRAVQLLSNLGLSIEISQLRQLSSEQRAQQLKFLGLPEPWPQELQSEQATANLIPLIAPRDGVVVTRDVVAGEVIDTSKVLFTVVDTSHLWLLLDVPVEQARYVQPGLLVRFVADGDSRTYEGPVTWISPEVEKETRTVKVRAELANQDGQLRSESFGSGQIVLREDPQAIVVPKEAIHWEGCCHVAFVRDRDYLKQGAFKVFHTRMVRPGTTSGRYTEVVAGLLPGEVVVTRGSGVLRAELLKGNLGAG
jgi:membrane fusion protein, heavy metal efflux system